MLEPIWIFTNAAQFSRAQEIIKHYSCARITENENQAILKSHENIVIIISPFSHEAQSKLNINNCYFYVGVRVSVDGFIAFEKIHELNQLLNDRERSFLHKIQLEYIQQLNPNSETDTNYLRQLIENYDSLIGGDLESQNKGFRLKKSKEKIKIGKHYKGLIAVYNCPQFAVTLAEKFKIKSLLLMEGNLLRPTLDDYLNINKIETAIESHLTGIDNTGLNIALDSLRKQTQIKQDLKHFVKKHKHYDVLLGNYNILNYEHYDTFALKNLVETMMQLYDCVIVNLGDNLYDYMTLMCLNRSDINVLCIEDTKNSIRWTKQMLQILNIKQFIEPSKYHIYKIKKPLKPQIYSKAVMATLFKKQYKGNINLNQKRSFNKVIKEIVK